MIHLCTRITLSRWINVVTTERRDRKEVREGQPGTHRPPAALSIGAKHRLATVVIRTGYRKVSAVSSTHPGVSRPDDLVRLHPNLKASFCTVTDPTCFPSIDRSPVLPTDDRRRARFFSFLPDRRPRARAPHLTDRRAFCFFLFDQWIARVGLVAICRANGESGAGELRERACELEREDSRRARDYAFATQQSCFARVFVFHNDVLSCAYMKFINKVLKELTRKKNIFHARTRGVANLLSPLHPFARD